MSFKECTMDHSHEGTTLQERIIEWNRMRNNLEFDPSLEVRMLSEEASEYFMATDPAHKLQEAADFFFVFTGTQAKFRATKFETITLFSIAEKGWRQLEAWMQETKDDIVGDLSGILGKPKNKTTWIITAALKIVTDANEAKPLAKEEGKTPKGEDYVSPLERIRKELFDEE